MTIWKPAICCSTESFPTQRKSTSSSVLLASTPMVHEQIRTFFNGFRRDAHPMAIMCGVVGALSAFYHDSTDISDSHHRTVAAYRLIAKMPTIAAMSYKFSIGQPFMYPDNSLNYAANFLHMMFGVPCEASNISPTIAKAMDRIFLLHADHEQKCIDVYGKACGLLAGKSVCVHCSRYRRSLGPLARRRQ